MRLMFAAALVVMILPASMAGTVDYPEWKDPLGDNYNAPYPFMDLVGGWAEVWADDSFYAFMEIALVPPAPGIGVPGNGLSYIYYYMYTVVDDVGSNPQYQDCPPQGTFISSFVEARWWNDDGPQNDPIWFYQFGCHYFIPGWFVYNGQGDVLGEFDLLSRTIKWTVGRGLPQTLIPQGCEAEGWQLTRMYGITNWFATAWVVGGVGLVNGPLEDRGPNAGFGRPFEFPECPGQQFKTGEETTEFSVSMGDAEIAQKRLEFADPFNGTHVFKWNSTSENVTISWDAVVQEGSVQMFVEDGAGEMILDAFMAESTDGSSTVRGAMPGEWKIYLEFDFFTREIGFEIVDAAKYQKQESGSVGGQATNGAEAQEDYEETGEGEGEGGDQNVDLGGANNLNSAADRDSPGVGLLTTLALLGAVFYLRRK